MIELVSSDLNFFLVNTLLTLFTYINFFTETWQVHQIAERNKSSKLQFYGGERDSLKIDNAQ
jgi:hypothetical protein